jgi:hypothetical protein
MVGLDPSDRWAVLTLIGLHVSQDKGCVRKDGLARCSSAWIMWIRPERADLRLRNLQKRQMESS